jgi:hypothetical protein
VRRIVTLRDAALYITKLPKAEHDTEEWQAAMQALLLVAEHDRPPMYARIGIEPSCRTRVRPVAQRQALGTAEVGAGSVSLLYILALRPRRDPRATSMIKLAFATFLLLIGPCSIKSSGRGREAGSLGTKTNPNVAFHDR